jgi:hypothetical protein
MDTNFPLLQTLQMLTLFRSQEFIHKVTKLPLTQQRMVPMCVKKSNNNGFFLCCGAATQRGSWPPPSRGL